MDDTSGQAKQKNKIQPNLFIRLIATVFFTGYSPIAPGTVGSLVGLIIYGLPGFEIPQIMGPLIFFFFLIGSYVSHRMEIYLGEDPACVIIDEVIGMWITLIFLPKTLLLVVLGFFAFRFFDITKLQPASYVERFGKGIGIMLDDVVAGIYSNILLHLTILIFPAIKTI
jgi:phosphatidylglycerophosphatase A